MTRGRCTSASLRGRARQPILAGHEVRSASNSFDALEPFHGPCGICGGPDARHRVVDAIASRLRAGESVESVAEDYGLSVEKVREVSA